MADITLCKGGKCKIKDLCYRFTCTKSNPKYQSYFVVEPVNESTGECEYFWDNEND
jgi:hypothetical protein